MARQALYTEQISSLVSEEMKVLINRLAEEYRVSQGEVVRLGLEGDGLKSVESLLRARVGLLPLGVGRLDA